MNVEYGRFNIIAMGWGLSAALFSLFFICLISAFLYPEVPATQGWAAWISLFTVTRAEHPFLSIRVWIDGILFSLFFGWVTAVAVSVVYNRLISR